jgi:ADP-ribose pyrophosphatase
MSDVRDMYRGDVVHLVIEHVRLPNGHAVDLEIVRHPGAAAVAAIDEQDRVTLIRQYRHAAGGWLWEVPAGKLDPGEDPDACARRELREEVGLEATHLACVGSILTCPGFCDERIHLYVATGLRTVAASRGADEVIDEVQQVLLADAMRMIDRGEIVDAKTIAAVVHAVRRERDGGARA